MRYLLQYRLPYKKQQDVIVDYDCSVYLGEFHLGRPERKLLSDELRDIMEGSTHRMRK